MSYTETAWHEDGMTSTQKLTGLNNMETQYDEGITYLDTITHGERYYTKTEMDARYFTAANDGTGSGLICETLDGKTAIELLAETVPSGIIAWWESLTPPNGWYLCNGYYGTPNLLNRFIIGAGNTYNKGDTGGSDSVTCAGSATITGHALTVDEIPSHYHVVNDYWGSGSAPSWGPGGGSVTSRPDLTTRTQYTSAYSGGQTHTHTASVACSLQDKRPPFKSLAAVMKG